MAMRHLPGRLPDARALRAHLPGRGQRRAPAGDDPPRAPGLDGAVRRHPDRAPRRPLPDLARPGAGQGPAGRRSQQRLRARGRRRSCATTACACEVDERSESVGKKIRDAELAKVPYMLVVGDKEQEVGAVALRSHDEGDLGASLASRSELSRLPWAPQGRRRRADADSRTRLQGRSRPGTSQPRRCVYTPPRCKAATSRRALERPCLAQPSSRPLSRLAPSP